MFAFPAFMDMRFRKVNMKKAKGLSCFLLLLMVNFSTGSQNLEVKKKLSQLNKTPLKSITSPDGDIIDCILVSHQPAFDHPLLKNHTIQMRPNYRPEGLVFDDNKVKPITQLWHLNGRCPEGTVPIRRTKEEDVLRASSVELFGKKQHKTIPKPKFSADLDQISPPGPGHEYAIAYVRGGKYYGTKATINLWNPHVQQPDEFSLSQLWILGGSFASDVNTIEAGWQVYPRLYGDYRTKLFIYWTRDAYKSTGCYNLLCSGFIQINNNIAFGVSSSSVSTYGGSQYAISLLVWKDPKGGNWWLQLGNDALGYWPASLFTNLVDSASIIEWGGEVVNLESDGMHTTTQMGSGHFPGEGFGKTNYFRNIKIVDGSNQLRDPDGLGNYAPKPNCYNVSLGKSNQWGIYFYHGGPGRNPNCP